VAAVCRDAEGAAHVLRIGPAAPRSGHDAFLLSLARARAEAIVTTGRILREEPALTHGLRGPPALREALAAWRRERLVLAHDPWLLVLSTGRALDPMHPAFHAAVRPILFVPSAAAAGLRERFAATDARVVSVRAPNERLSLDHLRRLGARRITIEAGPSAAAGLYDEPPRVDELWLATFCGAPPVEAIGPAFVPEARLAAVLPDASDPCEREEPSGTWRFERRRRAAG
jgi:riboflavin biosynthesis pyrimidine reductase